MVKGKVAIVVVSVVAAILVLALVIVPFFSGTSHGMDVQFYDENGDLIGDTFGYVNPVGDTVAGFRSTIWWKVVGVDADLSTLTIDGFMRVSVFSTLDRWNTLSDIPISEWGEEEADSNFWKDYDLDVLLANYMDEDYKTAGWLIKVWSSITAEMSDTGGNILEPQTVTDAVEFLLTWEEGSYILESGVSVSYG